MLHEERRKRGIAPAHMSGMRHSNAIILTRLLLRLVLGVLLFVATAFAENVLTIESVSQDKCRAVLDLTEAAGGIQFTLVGSTGVSISGVEIGRSVLGPGWIVAWNAMSDGSIRVLIMGRNRGALPAGRYELLTWTVTSDEGQGRLEFAEVVLANDEGQNLSVETRGFDWFRSRPTFALLGNFPNPFNPSTVISFTLERQASVSLEVYDIVGRRLDVVIDRSLEGGMHQVPWTTQGKRLATGVYIIRLTVDGRSAVSKMNVIQ